MDSVGVHYMRPVLGWEETADHLFGAFGSSEVVDYGGSDSIDMDGLTVEEVGRMAAKVASRHDRSVAAEVRRCLIPAGLWAIWKTRNSIIFGGQRFYFDNLWDAFSYFACEWGRELGGAARVEITMHGVIISG
ncbi:hypothetical protein QJS10_CPA02g00729 [Acorus calamus]|uniref:Uncharacterized protein n=1 Tax=Acorus calamus TaxID=4465 RepID=A0AAV9FEI0_ACOCL|nr:hypothetical protein QJS10_CPA02g00729 [Acorus calamus]